MELSQLREIASHETMMQDRKLRDDFAVAVLPWMLNDRGYRDSYEVVASRAYELADVMMEARKK